MLKLNQLSFKTERFKEIKSPIFYEWKCAITAPTMIMEMDMSRTFCNRAVHVNE